MASFRSRFQPDRRNRAKKLETALPRSCSFCQVSASDEVDPGVDTEPVDEPLAGAVPEEPVVQGKSPICLLFCAMLAEPVCLGPGAPPEAGITEIHHTREQFTIPPACNARRTF